MQIKLHWPVMGGNAQNKQVCLVMLRVHLQGDIIELAILLCQTCVSSDHARTAMNTHSELILAQCQGEGYA